jgi:hypothetical protein
MKCKMLIYHYDCFSCDICNKKFQPGDEYLIKNNNLLICKEDSINSINSNEVQPIQINRVTSTPASSLTVNTNYRNLINSDDSSFSPSVSSSSIESSISINHININHVNSNNSINNNPSNGTYETSSYSPLSVNYNSYSNIDHNSNDYNYQSLRGKNFFF